MSQRRNLLSLLAKVDPDIAENVRLEAVPGGFVNLTGYAVSDQIAALLSFGPRFLLPENTTIPDVLSGFGELNQQIERHIGMPVAGPIFHELLDTYKEERDKIFSLRQPSLMEVAIRQAVLETKEFFRQCPQACIVQSDKGNKTCLMLLTEYQSKMDAYVEKCVNKGVYQLTTQRRIEATHKIFSELRHAILDINLPQGEMELKKLCNQLRYFNNAKLPCLYGNVKCHKPDAPIRPICSTVSWYSRPIQKILHYMLKKYFGEALCKQNVMRINDVAKEVVNINRQKGYVFTKLDVTDMYGSMDKRRISMLLNRLLDTIESEGKSILPKAIVSRMIRFSLEQSCMVGYNEQIYVQVMGLPQGACDSGFLATIYLDYILQLHHEELFVSHRVHYWAKYMDDFLLYMPSKHISYFKQKMEYLTGLKFEIEPEDEVTEGIFFQQGIIRNIPFLDIFIHTTKEGPYLISNYRKPTASQRMIHALSNTIFAYKTNTMYGFINNLFKRTSTTLLMHDLNSLYSRMLLNGYSHNFIECIYYKAITEEVRNLRHSLQLTYNNSMLNGYKKEALVIDIRTRIHLLQGYQTTFSLDLKHHYQTIRDNYVAISKQPGYKFEYRSISLSRLVFTACQYANMPPPVYCRLGNSDVLRQYLGHKRIKEAMDAVEAISTAEGRRSHISIGMLRCITCGMVFIVSGRDKLQVIVEQEFENENSEISKHQLQLQHTISPAVQVLRPVTGVDTAYLCQLYLAIFHTMGVSTSDRFTLSSLPSFVRTMLYILRGALASTDFKQNSEPHPSTWLTTAVPYLPRFSNEALHSWDAGDEAITTFNAGHPMIECVTGNATMQPCNQTDANVTAPNTTTAIQCAELKSYVEHENIAHSQDKNTVDIQECNENVEHENVAHSQDKNTEDTQECNENVEHENVAHSQDKNTEDIQKCNENVNQNAEVKHGDTTVGQDREPANIQERSQNVTYERERTPPNAMSVNHEVEGHDTCMSFNTTNFSGIEDAEENITGNLFCGPLRTSTPTPPDNPTNMNTSENQQETNHDLAVSASDRSLIRLPTGFFRENSTHEVAEIPQGCNTIPTYIWDDSLNYISIEEGQRYTTTELLNMTAFLNESRSRHKRCVLPESDTSTNSLYECMQQKLLQLANKASSIITISSDNSIRPNTPVPSWKESSQQEHNETTPPSVPPATSTRSFVVRVQRMDIPSEEDKRRIQHNTQHAKRSRLF